MSCHMFTADIIDTCLVFLQCYNNNNNKEEEEEVSFSGALAETYCIAQRCYEIGGDPGDLM